MEAFLGRINGWPRKFIGKKLKARVWMFVSKYVVRHYLFRMGLDRIFWWTLWKGYQNLKAVILLIVAVDLSKYAHFIPLKHPSFGTTIACIFINRLLTADTKGRKAQYKLRLLPLMWLQLAKISVATISWLFYSY